MEISKVERGDELYLTVSGRIDATTAPTLEAELKRAAAEGGAAVIVDFAEVDYVSSAGLRALLVGAKGLAGQGRKLVVARARDDVLDVIRLTGFDRILTLSDDLPA